MTLSRPRRRGASVDRLHDDRCDVLSFSAGESRRWRCVWERITGAAFAVQLAHVDECDWQTCCRVDDYLGLFAGRTVQLGTVVVLDHVRIHHFGSVPNPRAVCVRTRWRCCCVCSRPKTVLVQHHVECSAFVAPQVAGIFEVRANGQATCFTSQRKVVVRPVTPIFGCH